MIDVVFGLYFFPSEKACKDGYGEGGDLEGLEGEEEDDQNIFKFKNMLNNKKYNKEKSTLILCLLIDRILTSLSLIVPFIVSLYF